MYIDQTLTKPQIHFHLSLLAQAKREGADEFWPWPIDDEIAAFQTRLNELGGRNDA